MSLMNSRTIEWNVLFAIIVSEVMASIALLLSDGGYASVVGCVRSADASGWINKRRRCDRITLQTLRTFYVIGKQHSDVSRQRSNTCRCLMIFFFLLSACPYIFLYNRVILLSCITCDATSQFNYVRY